jgi:hypothetical protein
MPLSPLIAKVYTPYATFVHRIAGLPLKARSLLIKQCQAQYDVIEPITTPTPTLIRLLNSHPDVVVTDLCDGRPMTLALRNFFSFYNVSVSDPLSSAIILDILRGVEVQHNDYLEAISSGWLKEIRLCLSEATPRCDFRSFFHDVDRPIHPSLPYNPSSTKRIRSIFRRFREMLILQPIMLYPRATHKNMSRSTRRAFESHFGEGSLDGIAVFGQDDWERVYHDYGIELEGEVEFRQKWYPSGAKPRTYAAMGGTSYRYCRHLPDFFTALVNLFRETNHVTRLRPGRLFIPGSLPAHFRVYDLSNFTSNCREQRSFCLELVEFFTGVSVTVVDEHYGPEERDLGEMLWDYYVHCVDRPLTSLERTPARFGLQDHISYQHGVASLLGIFGNLMTCTLAHFLILSPTVETPEEINIAGDDGLALEHDANEVHLDAAIELVGTVEKTKNFRSDEEGAICLKRPLHQIGSRLELSYNIVPPTVATALSYIAGKDLDPRFNHIGIEDLKPVDRVSLVGVDLLRFLRSCYALKYENVGLITAIFEGFEGAVRSQFNASMESLRIRWGHNLFWPIHPGDYDFLAVDPIRLWCIYYTGSRAFHVRERVHLNVWAFREVGDVARCNSNRRLVLLERLGFVEKESISIQLDGLDAADFMYNLFVNPRFLPPEVYSYRVIRDIPDYFMYEDF